MIPDIYSYAMADLYRSLGIIGFLIYVGNYTCLSLRILSSESALYFVINTCAASLVMLSLVQDFNLASALIQAFWIVIGSIAILLRLRKHLRERRLRQMPLHLHAAARGQNTHAPLSAAQANAQLLAARARVA